MDRTSRSRAPLSLSRLPLSRGAVLAAAVGTLLGAEARAGTILDTNLPAGTVIVNVSGTEDGAAAYDGLNQALWYQPFHLGASSLELTMQPGTYTFGITDPTDALARFPALTAGQRGQLHSAWTYNSPWATDYLVFDAAAKSDPGRAQLFTGSVMRQVAGAPGWIGGGYGSGAQAYGAAKLGGYDARIVAGPMGRYLGEVRSDYTFAVPTTLVFAVPDYYLPDNGGGVSVVVSRATPVPEPATVGALGLGVLGLSRRWRRGGTVLGCLSSPRSPR